MLLFLHPELYFKLRIFIDQYFDVAGQLLLFSFAFFKLTFQFSVLLILHFHLPLHLAEKIPRHVIGALSIEGIRLGLLLHNCNLISRMAAQVLIKHLKDTLIS